jgi:hypothetical protein
MNYWISSPPLHLENFRTRATKGTLPDSHGYLDVLYPLTTIEREKITSVVSKRFVVRLT